MGLEQWNTVFQILSVFALAFTFLVGGGAVWTSYELGKRQATRIAGLELRTAEQQERAATAERNLLDLQQRLAWRSFTKGQEEELVALLNPFKGRRVWLWPVYDVEAHRLAEQMHEIFTRAGWTSEVVPVARTPEPTGIECEFAPGNDGARLFADYLKSTGWAVEERALPESHESLGIVVGKKPPA